ncbi:MAG: substrate-binding domain-containing protein [Verrucomicrobia bacterium]|jgi:iron(III) transport system substrate-binding protein|nr:substrate-binding domain-containing protein [Verrucomicrobiota bacterium]
MSKESKRNWPQDEFGRQEVEAQWFLIIGIPLLIALVAVLATALLPGIAWLKDRKAGRVVLYCAQDQTYAEPILHKFETETGIRVKAVYDSEAVKTVGLANRLLAERDHPQCDVFWGNEEMRTRQLAAFNVWQETNGFRSFGARTRCLVINTNRVGPDRQPAPSSLLELTNAVWRGRVAMAFPQFGTTATHFHVLRLHWGEALWEQWCRALVANEARILDGNSTVVKRVARGEAWLGLTDTDDVLAAQREGLPVARGPELPETRLFIPNTVGIVRGAPHPKQAQALADYLQRPETVERLVAAGAIQYPEMPSPGSPVLQPEWERLLADLDSTTEKLNGIFLR